MATIESVLAAKRQIGMDTSPFIYYFERHPTYFELVHAIIEHVENRPNTHLMTSALTLLETIVFPLRNQRADLVEHYRNVLTETDYLDLIELEVPVIVTAAEIRAKYNLRTPDAIQIGTCIHRQADLFVTNDKTFRRVQEIEILLLDDFVLQ